MSVLRIWIDASSRVPPFEQVRGQLRLMVASGSLRAGERLPPIRLLAQDLGLSPGTVARAYRELEYAGILETRGRAGTFVVQEPPVAFSVIERHLSEAAETFARTVRELGVAEEDAVAAFRAACETQLNGTGTPD